MLICSVKLTKTKIIGALFVCAAIALIMVMSFSSAAVATAGKQTLPASTQEERLAIFKQYGWEVVETPAEIVEVTIPKKFDATYTSYNALQEKQGLDLSKYKGDAAKRYTYEITNYPSEVSGTVLANIIVRDGKVIAADICSVDLGGFMHELLIERSKVTPIKSESESSMTAGDLLDGYSQTAK